MVRLKPFPLTVCSLPYVTHPPRSLPIDNRKVGSRSFVSRTTQFPKADLRMSKKRKGTQESVKGLMRTWKEQLVLVRAEGRPFRQTKTPPPCSRRKGSDGIKVPAGLQPSSANHVVVLEGDVSRCRGGSNVFTSVDPYVRAKTHRFPVRPDPCFY